MAPGGPPGPFVPHELAAKSSTSGVVRWRLDLRAAEVSLEVVEEALPSESSTCSSCCGESPVQSRSMLALKDFATQLVEVHEIVPGIVVCTCMEGLVNSGQGAIGTVTVARQLVSCRCLLARQHQRVLDLTAVGRTGRSEERLVLLGRLRQLAFLRKDQGA